MEKSVDLSKGQIKFLMSEIDVKQDFYLKLFENLGSVIVGLKDVVETTASVYNNLPNTQKSKTIEPNFKDLIKSLDTLFELHVKHLNDVNSFKKERKTVEPAVKLTLEELQEQDKQRILELEALEQTKLNKQ